jgi:hypothetical protein
VCICNDHPSLELFCGHYKGNAEYFRCMTGNTAEAWSHCSSRSDGDMLRVWFSYSLSVPSEHGIHGIKMTVPPEVCTKDNQHAIVRFMLSEGMKGQRSIDN